MENKVISAELKAKWEDLIQKGQAGCVFDTQSLSPGKFFMHISDAGGESMSCYTQTETTGFFEDSMDAPAFLRWVQIPRILDFDTDSRETQPEIADAYLLKYNEGERKLIDRAIGLIDQPLMAEEVTKMQLDSIQVTFNRAFLDTNPEVQILTWGSIIECLTSDYFTDVFIDDIEYEANEKEKPSTMLKKLLDSGKFDEKISEHLSLARGFLERRVSV